MIILLRKMFFLLLIIQSQFHSKEKSLLLHAAGDAQNSFLFWIFSLVAITALTTTAAVA